MPVKEIEQYLNNFFFNICGWFFDDKLSIRFGDDEIKIIQFGTKHKLIKIGNLDIRHGAIHIKQYHIVSHHSIKISLKNLRF